MIREQAKEKVPAWLSHLIPLLPEKQIKWCRYHIDEIYDDFEYRKCKNCTFYDKTEFLCNEVPKNDGWILDELDRIMPNPQFSPDENFGCTLFKSKQGR